MIFPIHRESEMELIICFKITNLILILLSCSNMFDFTFSISVLFNCSIRNQMSKTFILYQHYNDIYKKAPNYDSRGFDYYYIKLTIRSIQGFAQVQDFLKVLFWELEISTFSHQIHQARHLPHCLNHR